MNTFAADTAKSSSQDAGVTAFISLLAIKGIAADAGHIKHRFGGAGVGLYEMLRLSKELGLKARVLKTSWTRLAHTPLPGIAALKTGGFLLIAKTDAQKALVQAPGSRPKLMTREELEGEWDGRLLLVTTRAGLVELARRFDLTWFLGAVWKYRWLLSEVLVASFFLQVFALVSPLFFQVVIDKVLVHRTEATLDVLVIGLVCIAIFEAIMGGLRTYLFAHTTNRIDVELGARLFRHLLALPLAYFQARRVGDSLQRFTVRWQKNLKIAHCSSAVRRSIGSASPCVQWCRPGVVTAIKRSTVVCGRGEIIPRPGYARMVARRGRRGGADYREGTFSQTRVTTLIFPSLAKECRSRRI